MLTTTTLFGCKCEDDTSHGGRTVNYRIHSLKDGQVQIKWLDSAYVAGDTIALPFDSTNATQYVIIQRVQ